jgi:endonuclease/exonuclease/phosphatase family metal-dependent hydrolase
MVNAVPDTEHVAATRTSLKLLTYNIQVGIQTKKYRHYVTKGWKHVLPHEKRVSNLRRIAKVVADYDLVALQEIDGGSLRSGYVNQVEFLAQLAQFPYWYSQLNRDLGPIARQGNGILSRVAFEGLEDHKLPGVIPGRGAIVARVSVGDSSIFIVQLHLSLGQRSRGHQLSYIRELIQDEEHVVVMGDLNSHTGNLLFNSPLRDTKLQPVERVQPTYPSWRPEVALDHILVTPGLRLSDYAVLDCQHSDHRPISVTIETSSQQTLALM